MPMPKIVVHHLEHSRSQRILWLLEALEVPYEVEIHARDPKTMRAPDSLRKIHPLGRAPLVVVNGEVLAESGAIIEAIIERFGAGRLRPTSEAGLTAYRYWLHYAEGSLMPPLLVALIVDQLRAAPVPFFMKPIMRAVAKKLSDAYSGPEVRNHVAFIEGALVGKNWLAGDAMSGADIQMSYPLEALLSRGDLEAQGIPCANIRAYVTKLQADPAYQRALQRVGGTFGTPSGPRKAQK
jgi:glutathione S-transferase